MQLLIKLSPYLISQNILLRVCSERKQIFTLRHSSELDRQRSLSFFLSYLYIRKADSYSHAIVPGAGVLSEHTVRGCLDFGFGHKAMFRDLVYPR